jgi:hypothetical protein
MFAKILNSELNELIKTINKLENVDLNAKIKELNAFHASTSSIEHLLFALDAKMYILMLLLKMLL